MKGKLLKYIVLCFTVILAFSFASCDKKSEINVIFSVDGKEYSSYSAVIGEKTQMPKDPIKEGYNFTGWYFYFEEKEKEFNENSLIDYKIDSDITIYAKWEIRKPTDELHTIDEYLSLREDGTYYGKVSKDTERYDFDGKISYDGKYVVYREPLMDPLENNIATLETGDNGFYILFDNGESATAVVRRRPVYRVEFRSEGGFVLISEIEEDMKATAPKYIKRDGYTLSGWDKDLDISITGDTVINAIWTANIDTPYKIEYYLRNLENNYFTLTDTEYLTGTTGEAVTVDREFEHFSVIEPSRYGTIQFNGVISVYYERNRYQVYITSSGNVTLDKSYYSIYRYGYRIDEITATFNDVAGYKWVGWMEDGELLTAEKTLPAFNVESNVTIIAKTEIDTDSNVEMLPFNYTQDELSCTVTGLKDKTVKEITIPDYVTEIGMWAFGNNTNLERVTIGNGVRHINGCAFYGCKNLQSVTLGNNVEIINGMAFQGCSSLTEINIPEKVQLIGAQAFSDCDSLVSINVAEDNVQYKSIDGNLYDKNAVMLMQYTAGKTATEFTIPATVTEIGDGAFSGCSWLNDINIGDNVERIKDYAFIRCTNLVEIDIPDGVKSIGNQAFSWCDNLERVAIGSGTQFIFSSFSDCPKLIEINVSEENTFYKSLDGNLYDKSGEILYKYAVGKTETAFSVPDDVTTIGGSAFSGSKNLITVNIPKGVTCIGQSAFLNCTGLTEIIIPDSVLTICSWAFAYCDNLERINISNIAVIEDYTFIECFKLKDITIPTSVKGIGALAFSNCNSLIEVNIPDSVLRVGNNAFFSCDNLESVYIGKNLCDLGKNTFLSCYNLKNIDVSAENINFKSIDGNLYDKNGKRIVQYSIGKTDPEFSIPNDIEVIGESAFDRCKNLVKITIPSSVIKIEVGAFYYCENLSEIDFKGTKTEWLKVEKALNWNANIASEFTVICTDGVIEYKPNNI